MNPELSNANISHFDPADADPIEAVVAVFEDATVANRAAAAMQHQDLVVHRVSRRDPKSENELPQIAYDPIQEIEIKEGVDGMLKGGAIGAGSGLLLLGIPGLNIAAPFVGAIVGAWIGNIAQVDEANRAAKLPNQEDYRRMLATGKSFVVIPGDEATRIEAGNKLKELGAQEIWQHPPVLHALRKPTTQ
jgi:hypothetical protein